MECPLGMYSDSIGSYTCKKCPQGYYTEDKKSCLPCNSGNYPNFPFSYKCLKCSEGRISSNGEYACRRCNDTNKIAVYEGGVSFCTDCPSDTYPDLTQKVCFNTHDRFKWFCPPGTEGNYTNGCTKCKPGFFSHTSKINKNN